MSRVTAPSYTTPSDVSDHDLVRRWRQKDHDAARELMTRYNRRLFRLVRGVIKDDVEAEDVVQEAYVRAFTHLDQFRGDAEFGTWLTRIALNEALGRRRRQRPTVSWSNEDDEAQLHGRILQFPTASVPDGPEATMAQRELREYLERAIDDLPSAFRTVFIARAVEGLSVEETATLLRLRPETVKTRLHRARTRLRESLEAQLGPALGSVFAFDGERCQRMTDAVMRRLADAS